MKRLKKYQIDGEFSNMKELKGVTKPLRDSHWYDQTKTHFPIHYQYENALENPNISYNEFKNRYHKIIPDWEEYGKIHHNESYDKYRENYKNLPIDTSDPNFLNNVIDLTNKAYSPELYNEYNGHPNNTLWRRGYNNNNFFDEENKNTNNDYLMYNIFHNHNFNSQHKDQYGNQNEELGNCYIDSNGFKTCGYNIYELGDKRSDFDLLKKYKADTARRTYQIATRDFTPYDFEGMLNQPKSYRMADESENTPIAYGPENLFVLPNKDVQEKPRINSIEDLYYKELNQLPSQNVEVPDINRNVQPLPESKPGRAPKTIKLTPQEEAEFFKKNNIQPIQKNKTRKLTPAEEIEFKKKYNIK